MTDAQSIFLIISIYPRVRPGSVDSFRQWKACRMRGQSVWTAEIIVSSWCLSKALNRSADYINYSASCTLMGFCEWKIHRLWSRHFILTLDLVLSEKRSRGKWRGDRSLEYRWEWTIRYQIRASIKQGWSRLPERRGWCSRWVPGWWRSFHQQHQLHRYWPASPEATHLFCEQFSKSTGSRWACL